MFAPIRVRFELEDEARLVQDPREPIHLDALIALAALGHARRRDMPSRDERPDDIMIPVRRWRLGNVWGWCASALFPAGRYAMEAWCVGDRREIRRELIRAIQFLGAGDGVEVREITVERVEDDWSLVREGRAQRWLPDVGGKRIVRPRPPYWNRVGHVRCCEVGDEYVLPASMTFAGGEFRRGLAQPKFDPHHPRK